MGRKKDPNSKSNLMKIRKDFAERLLFPHVFLSGMYGREMALATKLITEYPDYKLWAGINLSFQLNSLGYFLTPPGREIIRKEKLALNLELPIRTKSDILTKPIVEAPTSFSKNRTLKDFLNN